MREEKEDMIRKMKVYRARCKGREGRYLKEDEMLIEQDVREEKEDMRRKMKV